MASNIAIGTFVGAGGAGSIKMVLSGVTEPFEVIDGSHRANEAKAITKIALSMLNSGDTGSTTVRVYRDGTSGPTSQDFILAANGGLNSSITILGSPIALVAGDIIWADVIDVASSGLSEELTVEIIF